jgi:hypothetical protein
VLNNGGGVAPRQSGFEPPVAMGAGRMALAEPSTAQRRVLEVDLAELNE